MCEDESTLWRPHHLYRSGAVYNSARPVAGRIAYGKKEGEGFSLGVEYLCTVHLLSQCCSLIASGECGAVGEAIRENGGKYQHVYIFHL